MLKFSLAIHYSFIYSIKWGLNSHILASQALGIGFKMTTKNPLTLQTLLLREQSSMGLFLL